MHATLTARGLVLVALMLAGLSTGASTSASAAETISLPLRSAVRALLDDAAASLRRLPLLGAPAAFPLGPLYMAAMLKRPVLFMTGLYRDGNRYDVHFETLADFSDVRREARAAAVDAALARYVALLDRYCRAAPYNWFNYFDFWQGGDAATVAARSSAARAAAGLSATRDSDA